MTGGIDPTSWRRIGRAVKEVERQLLSPPGRQGRAATTAAPVWVEAGAATADDPLVYDAEFRFWDETTQAWVAAGADAGCFARDAGGGELAAGTVYLGAVVYQYDTGRVLVQVVGPVGSSGGGGADCLSKLVSLRPTDCVTFTVVGGDGFCDNISAKTIKGYYDEGEDAWVGVTPLPTGNGNSVVKMVRRLAATGLPAVYVDEGGTPELLLAHVRCVGAAAEFAGSDDPWCDSEPVTTCDECPAGAPKRYRVELIGATGDNAWMNGYWIVKHPGGAGCEWEMEDDFGRGVTGTVSWYTVASDTYMQALFTLENGLTVSATASWPTADVTDCCVSIEQDQQVGVADPDNLMPVMRVDPVGPCAETSCADNTFRVRVTCTPCEPCDNCDREVGRQNGATFPGQPLYFRIAAGVLPCYPDGVCGQFDNSEGNNSYTVVPLDPVYGTTYCYTSKFFPDCDEQPCLGPVLPIHYTLYVWWAPDANGGLGAWFAGIDSYASASGTLCHGSFGDGLQAVVDNSVCAECPSLEWATYPGGTYTPYLTVSCRPCAPVLDIGECCDGADGPLNGHPDLEMVVPDGPNAGTYTLTWNAGSSQYQYVGAVTFKVTCTAGAWTLQTDGGGTTGTLTASCDPFGLTFPGAAAGGTGDITVSLA